MSRALRRLRDGLLGLAYPEQCRVCGGSVESWDDGVACAKCWDDPALTKTLTGNICAKCGAPMTSSTGISESVAGEIGQRLCRSCFSAPFTAARACGIYSGAFEASILFLKITPHICPRLRAILRNTFSRHQPVLESDVVIPVPLHPLRERQRGFNQAGLIAGQISRKFDLRLDDRSLIRIKPTDRHRAGMDANDRSQSVRSAFEVVRPRLIEGGSVLLVDDVYTTGSTICAAAQSLLDAGARSVNVLTLARAGYR